MQLNLNITPYYQNLLDSLGPNHPLRRTVEPFDDRAPAPGELADPLGEEAHSPCPGLIHTYPDKVLLLATLTCAVHCQYCTRGRLITHAHTFKGMGMGFSSHWKKSDEKFQGLEKNSKPQRSCFQYLETHTEIRDVLISGGDPLTLSDAELDELFSRVWKSKHIRTVRLGSKVPAVLPSRVTPELAAILAKHRIWLQLHFIHPAELTAETTCALDTLAAAGVPMVSQTVLLKGINDEADTLADLFYGLLERRVKPYYLFQCDPVLGSSSFRTPVQRGLDLMCELQGRVSGLALPHFCIDAPGGGGKITLLPDTVLRRDGHEIVLTNYQGKEYRYPDDETVS
ncbi:MAG: KamA family radical SAM protein [Verrucomicrobia bacterium]|nr:KamA family radical SAM protein [Verrucomicrobiota bacterium]